MSYTASVITVSDLGSRGLRQDTSGPAVRAMLEDAGFTVVHTAIVPDERGQISALLRACADEKRIDLILTTGGTGLSPRDVTPEATAEYPSFCRKAGSVRMAAVSNFSGMLLKSPFQSQPTSSQ